MQHLRKNKLFVIKSCIEKYKKLDLTTQEGKQRLIDGFINAIYVYDDRITFTYNYKDGTETITLSELESAKSSDIKCVGAPKTGQSFGCPVFSHRQAVRTPAFSGVRARRRARSFSFFLSPPPRRQCRLAPAQKSRSGLPDFLKRGHGKELRKRLIFVIILPKGAAAKAGRI